MTTIEETIRANTRHILDASASAGVLPREAALQFARQRVTTAMSLRRWSIC